MRPDLSREVLLAPRSVAVVGASDDPAKTTSRPLAFLKQHGFKGAIWPVNRQRASVQDLKAYPSLRDLPGRPDHAFILLAGAAGDAALEDALALEVPLVTMLAGGFGESGSEGVRRERLLHARLAGTQTRLLGPNSIGLVNTRTGLALTANAAFRHPTLHRGKLSVISQSGSAIGTFASRGRVRGIGFANLISVGNEADLSVGEIGRLLLDDPETETILLFLESIKHCSQLEDFAEAAIVKGKPVAVYKLGRSEVGARLAVSHTGAMISSDRAVDALFGDLGFRRVDVLESLFECAPLLRAAPRSRPELHPRVAIVTTTGGGGALVADRLGLSGIAVEGPTESVRLKAQEMGIDLGEGPLIDLTLAGTKPEVMRRAIAAVMAEPIYDAVVAAIGSSAEAYPELAVQPIAEFFASQPATKPLCVFTVPQADKALWLLADAGIAAFRTPEACADSLAACLRPVRTRFHPGRNAPKAADVEARLGAARGRMTEPEALALFAGLGVSCAPYKELTVAEAKIGTVALSGIGEIVAAKLVSRDLPHKSDLGAVRLGIRTPGELSAAVDDMLASVAAKAPRARIDGVLVQQQVCGVQETIVGLTRDAAIGPILTVGVGGILAELYGDCEVRRGPVSVEVAADMIERVRGLAVSRGYRGRPKGDLQRLAETVAAFSQLSLYSSVQEAEMNPVIVCVEGRGAYAVDGLVVLQQEA